MTLAEYWAKPENAAWLAAKKRAEADGVFDFYRLSPHVQALYFKETS